jgi:hypothetical protein
LGKYRIPEESKNKTARISAKDAHELGWPEPAAEVASIEWILILVARSLKASMECAFSIALRLAAGRTNEVLERFFLVAIYYLDLTYSTLEE